MQVEVESGTVAAAQSPSVAPWVLSIALVCALLAMYAPGFTMDYLTNDEVAMIGRHWEDYDFSYHALAHGRPLSFYRPFIYSFVGYSPTRIQLVRFLSLAGLAAVAVFLFRFLCRESERPWFSFFTTLFLFSQLPFQTFSGFGLELVSYLLPTFCLSLTAFWLHFYVFPKRNIHRWLANGIVLLLLFAAMQSVQGWAFLAMAPMSFLVLHGSRERLVQARNFLLLGAAAIVISVPVYLLGLQVLAAQGRHGYGMGQGAVDAASSTPLQVLGHAANPWTYWSAFKLWTYPYPIHDTPPNEARRRSLAMAVMFLWMGLVAAAIATELRDRTLPRRSIIAKWLMAILSMGFGAFVLLAASPEWVREIRPHLTLVLSAITIFIGAYALLALSRRFEILRSRGVRALGITLVLATAFGAQTGALRGYVDTRGDQLDFIRTELSSKRAPDFDRVVVVLGPRKELCVSEPCDLYSGRVTHSWTHARRPERYLYALSTLGINPANKTVLVVEGEFDPQPRDLVIDWSKFYRARKLYARNFR